MSPAAAITAVVPPTSCPCSVNPFAVGGCTGPLPTGTSVVTAPVFAFLSNNSGECALFAPANLIAVGLGSLSVNVSDEPLPRSPVTSTVVQLLAGNALERTVSFPARIT